MNEKCHFFRNNIGVLGNTFGVIWNSLGVIWKNERMEEWKNEKMKEWNKFGSPVGGLWGSSPRFATNILNLKVLLNMLI